MAENPSKDPKELAMSIYKKAMCDDENRSVSWTHTEMTTEKIVAIEHRNFNAKAPVRLDLARDCFSGQIEYDYLPVTFVAGQTTIMHMEEQLELWLVIKTSLFAAAEAIQRSTK